MVFSTLGLRFALVWSIGSCIITQMDSRNYSVVYIFLLVLSSWSFVARVAEGAELNEVSLSQANPKICTGFDAESGKALLGRLDADLAVYSCPTSHALFGVHNPGSSDIVPFGINLIGNCCPLPHDDILTDEHVRVSDACPPGYVVTGGGTFSLCDNCEKFMKCTKINTKRYQLGPQRSGVAWGVDSRGVYFWKERKRIKRKELPVAIRFGVSRRSRWIFEPAGCVGDPMGSIPVRKTSKRCKGIFFRQLQYVGLIGDPPAGTPVKMFPDCHDIDDILSNNPRCIVREE